MVRVVVVLVSLTLACYPAQAVAPAVLIAKEIVKQIIFDFVQARVEDGIRASFGPCKADLAEDAVKTSRTLTGLLRGSSGAGMPNIGALGNVGTLGSLGAVGGQVRTVRNLQNVQSTADSVASAANLVGAAGGGEGAAAVAQMAGSRGRHRGYGRRNRRQRFQYLGCRRSGRCTRRRPGHGRHGCKGWVDKPSAAQTRWLRCRR